MIGDLVDKIKEQSTEIKGLKKLLRDMFEAIDKCDAEKLSSVRKEAEEFLKE